MIIIFTRQYIAEHYSRVLSLETVIRIAHITFIAMKGIKATLVVQNLSTAQEEQKTQINFSAAF